MSRLTLGPLELLVVLAYLVLALAVGAAMRRRSGTDKESYFLAGRDVPWWWAGLSIAATTFAADTPLAVTGIVADRGLSGNWLWLSWIGIHAAVVVYFAARWRRSRVVTDAELVSLRYSGPLVPWLRSLRAGVAGLLLNAIVMGWVMRAMVKIVQPFFHWREWLPGPLEAVERIWPPDSPLGSPSDGLTILALLALVGLYSTLGGIRGVMLTDLLQLGLAWTGSLWLAVAAWRAVGGRDGLSRGLAARYGENHGYLGLFPALEDGWVAALGVGAFGFGLYLLVQSFAGSSSDGGGYMMQRLGSTRTPRDAGRAAFLFLTIQYHLRSWPWFLVALSALVLIPKGGEAVALGGAAVAVAQDRELAYPVLMGVLLPPLGLGLLLTSLLAAFMSTIDTHLNWGASYVVNDFYLRLRPQAGERQQVRAARIAVVGFTVLAALVSFRIDTIEQAWKWVAAVGAALGVPTALRWVWWRVNAAAEIGAMVTGLAAALLLHTVLEVPYELGLVWIAAASLAGLLAGIALGRATDREVLDAFVKRVAPLGLWPGGARSHGLLASGLRWLSCTGGTLLLLDAAHRLLLGSPTLAGVIEAGAGAASLAWGAGAVGADVEENVEEVVTGSEETAG